MKLRYVLPLAQMILAAVTLWRFHFWIAVADRIDDSAGNPDGFDAVLLMNSLVSIARKLLSKLSHRWADAMYVASVGILWLWLSLIVDSWYERRQGVRFRWASMRIAIYLALIALGPYSIWQRRNIDLVQMAQFDWPWCVPASAACLFWVEGAPLLFGRDVVHC